MKEQCELFNQGNNGHAVVLLPGLCGSKLELGLIPNQLTQNGYTIAIPSVPGYSAHAGFAPFELWIDSVHRFCSEFRTTHNSLSIVGMSLGSTLALATSAKYQEVDNLVCLSTTLQLDGWAIPWYDHLLKLAYQIGFRNWIYQEVEPYGVKDARLREVIKRAVRMNHVSALGAAQLPADHLYQCLKLMDWTKKHLTSVKSNLFIMHSTEDDTASLKNAQEVLSKISSDIKQSSWVTNSYHMISVDYDKERVAKETLEFLNTMLS
jgi:carboxylesterase